MGMRKRLSSFVKHAFLCVLRKSIQLMQNLLQLTASKHSPILHWVLMAQLFLLAVLFPNLVGELWLTMSCLGLILTLRQFVRLLPFVLVMSWISVLILFSFNIPGIEITTKQQLVVQFFGVFQWTYPLVPLLCLTTLPCMSSVVLYKYHRFLKSRSAAQEDEHQGAVVQTGFTASDENVGLEENQLLKLKYAVNATPI